MSASPTPDAVGLFEEFLTRSTDYAPMATGSSSPCEASDPFKYTTTTPFQSNL